MAWPLGKCGQSFLKFLMNKTHWWKRVDKLLLLPSHSFTLYSVPQYTATTILNHHNPTEDLNKFKTIADLTLCINHNEGPTAFVIYTPAPHKDHPHSGRCFSVFIQCEEGPSGVEVGQWFQAESSWELFIITAWSYAQYNSNMDSHQSVIMTNW